MSAFEHVLKNCLADYQVPTQCYRNLGFSSKDFSVLNQVSLVLKALLPNYTFWDGNQPNENNAPALNCSHWDFIEQAFDLTHTGLMISESDYWLSRWHILEKQAFWSALRTRFGGHSVII
jgi:hypothetical protein